jgi:predicted ArsR family transcriptional regulator
MGFEPEVDGDSLEVHLHHCPFDGAARKRTEVVCGAHLGLARGVLIRHQGPLRVERLDPFAESGDCVLHLSRD